MKVLIIAYKIEKDKGSEDGSGYNNIIEIAKKCEDLTLISRVNNIEKLEADPHFKNVNLIGVDVPEQLSFYKKKSRGIILYYYLWQYFVGRKVKSLQNIQQFDIVHQFNFHADWAPHFLKNEHGKLIWGPIAHHPYVGQEFLFYKPVLSWLREAAFWFAKQCFWINPFLKLAIHRTDQILYANEDLAWPFEDKKLPLIFQNYAGSAFKAIEKKDISHDTFQCLFVGRFVDLKGTMIALKAFQKHVKDTKSSDRPSHMTFIGKGPLLDTLEEYIDAAGFSKYCTIVQWVDQKELLAYYKNAHVFVYPSFEAQGLVIAEALSQGTPTITIEGTGPDYVAGKGGLSVVRSASAAKTTKSYAKAINTIYQSVEEGRYHTYIDKALTSYKRRLTWPKIGDRILSIYKEALNNDNR